MSWFLLSCKAFPLNNGSHMGHWSSLVLCETCYSFTEMCKYHHVIFFLTYCMLGHWCKYQYFLLIWRRDFKHIGCVYKIECVSLVPRVWDHSDNDLKKMDFSSTTRTSTPLNVQLFLYLHNAHSKHRGNRFQAQEPP